MTPSINADIDRIDAWRRKNGLSFAEVARLTGLHKNTVFYVLTRSRTSCTLRTLSKLEALVPENFIHVVPSPVSREAERSVGCAEIPNNAPKICEGSAA
jgi:lambda repressor-like predicted transcriptional regulator